MEFLKKNYLKNVVGFIQEAAKQGHSMNSINKLLKNEGYPDHKIKGIMDSVNSLILDNKVEKLMGGKDPKRKVKKLLSKVGDIDFKESDSIKSIDFSEDVKKVMLILDDLLEKLPDKEIEKFAASPDFELYKKVYQDVTGKIEESEKEEEHEEEKLQEEAEKLPNKEDESEILDIQNEETGNESEEPNTSEKEPVVKLEVVNQKPVKKKKSTPKKKLARSKKKKPVKKKK